jgi:hypothetical protein
LAARVAGSDDAMRISIFRSIRLATISGNRSGFPSL